MFNKRRSEIQIIGEILELSRYGAKKTEILYQSNMSFTQLQNYLSFLLEKNIEDPLYYYYFEYVVRKINTLSFRIESQ